MLPPKFTVAAKLGVAEMPGEIENCRDKSGKVFLEK